MYYFVKTEGGPVNGTVISTIYYLPPAPSSGREIPLMLKFPCYKPIITFEKMKTFVKKALYGYNFTGTITKEGNNDEEGEMSIGMVSDT